MCVCICISDARARVRINDTRAPDSTYTRPSVMEIFFGVFFGEGGGGRMSFWFVHSFPLEAKSMHGGLSVINDGTCYEFLCSFIFSYALAYV